MAAFPWNLYSNAVLSISKKLIDLSADTFVMTLHTASYTPAPDTDALWSAVSGTELSTAGGYTAGGLVLASETDTLAASTVTFKATSPSWSTFTAGPFRYGVITRRAGGSLVSGDLLLCFSDLNGGGGSLTGSGSAFIVTINATTGVFQITHTP